MKKSVVFVVVILTLITGMALGFFLGYNTSREYFSLQFPAKSSGKELSQKREKTKKIPEVAIDKNPADTLISTEEGNNDSLYSDTLSFERSINQQDSIYAEENNPGNDTLSVFKEPVVADNSNRESPEEEREEFIEEENVDIIKTEVLQYEEKVHLEFFEKQEAEDDSLSNILSERLILKTKPVNIISVEWWNSPVNFRGYQFNGRKLMLYGTNAREIRLFKVDSSYYLFSGGVLYRLIPNQKNQPFLKTENPQLMAVINEEN